MEYVNCSWKTDSVQLFISNLLKMCIFSMYLGCMLAVLQRNVVCVRFSNSNDFSVLILLTWTDQCTEIKFEFDDS